MKENEPFNIDSFWPEASTMLDQHFARKRAIRRLRFFALGGFALIVSVLAFIFGSMDVFNSAAQKPQDKLSKSESEKAVQTERLADAQSNSSEKISSVLDEIPPQNISENQSEVQPQSNDSDKKGGKNTKVQVTEHQDKTWNQPVNVVASPVLQKNAEKEYSDSEKSSASNSNESAVLKGVDVLQNDYSEKKPTVSENENSTITSEVELTLAEPIDLIETENAPNSDSSSSNVKTIVEDVLNNPLGGIVPELSETKNSRWEWALVPSIGMFNTVKQFNSSTSESAYVARRTQEEESAFRESFRMGLELNKARLTLQSGIYYSVYGERTAYTNWLMRTLPEIEFYNQVVYDTSFSLVSYLDMGNFYEISVAYIDSSVQTFSDTTMVTAQSTVDAIPFHVQNRISYIEVPLGVRYTAFRNSRVDVGISAGGSLGFLWRSRGYVVNSGLDEFVQLDVAAGLQKIIGNARIAADVRFKLSENLQIGMRPEWNTTIGGVLLQNSVRQNYQNWGMLLELKKTF